VSIRGAPQAMFPNPCSSLTILVVEDEPPVRLMVADALRDTGFQVVEAGNGDEALTMVESGNPPIDLVFTDLRMPGRLDGVALVRRVRETHPGLKVAVASAYSPDWPSPNMVDLFIGKPIDIPRTISRLKILLGCESDPVH
jgi:CheY-like chemotaxis protein